MERIPIRNVKAKVFRVRLSHHDTHVPVVSTTEVESLSGSEQYIDLPACPCGRVMHSTEEVFAFCTVGGEDEPLCKKCARLKCDICGNIVCEDHSLTYGSSRCCKTHGIFQRFLLSWNATDD